MSDTQQSLIQQLLAIPSNRAPLNSLLDLLRTKNDLVPVLGEGLNGTLGLPTWSQFLMQVARDTETFVSSLSSRQKVFEILKESVGETFLDDAIEGVFGEAQVPRPVPSPVGLVAYFVTDVAVTTNLHSALEYALSDAGARPTVMADAHQPFTATGYDKKVVKLNGDLNDRTDRALGPADSVMRLAEGVSQRDAMIRLAAKRSLLLVGYGGVEPPLLDILVAAQPHKHWHYMLIAGDGAMKRSAALYKQHVRPIWYPEPMLSDLLRYLIDQMQNPPLGRPLPLVAAAEAIVPSKTILTAESLGAVAHRSATEADAAPATQWAPIEVPPKLVEACRSRECVAFVGSGMSARAGLPTWNAFVSGLLDRASSLNLMSSEQLETQRAALDEGAVNAVADNVVSAFSGHELELLTYYEVNSQHVPTELPAAFHTLAQIPFSAVLTSNYDVLLERAYMAHPRERINTPRDSEKLLDLLSSRKDGFLVKLYGDVRKPETLIYAPAEYQNLVRTNAAFARFMEGLFFSRTLFFVGTSLDGLTDYLSAFTFPSGVPREHFALIATKGKGWRAKAQVLQRRYNITVIDFPESVTYPEVDQFLEDFAKQTRTPIATRAVTGEGLDKGRQILKLTLTDIGPFKSLELNFDSLWTILLGDNGVGKSTILKALAVAIVGSDARHVAARLLRHDSPLGTIQLVTRRNPHGYMTQIQRVGAGAEVVSHVGRTLEAEGWVALGFPPLRATSWLPAKGPQAAGKKHPSASDLLPLVQGDVDTRMDDLKQWIVNMDALRNKQDAPEIDRARADKTLETFFRIVTSLSEGFEIAFAEVTTDFHLRVSTPDGPVPIEALSQGLTSLLSWVGILVQRLYEVHFDPQGEVDPMQQFALVLMDEIDAHMHPKWQQALVSRLKSFFPAVQFIATTHSPLIVGGLAPTEVKRFTRDEQGEIVMIEVDEKMMLGRPDQILSGDLFSLETLFDEHTRAEMSRYQQLLGLSKRSEEQEAEFQNLRRVIRQRIPLSASTPPERLAQELLRTILQEQLGEDGGEAGRVVEARAEELLEAIKKRQVATP
jgi:hypothetical protein